MQVAELLFLLQWVTFSSAVALVCFKYLHLAMTPKTKNLLSKSKWIGWYQYEELKQLNSPHLWETVQQNNRITTAMWVCTLLCAGLFIVNGTL